MLTPFDDYPIHPSADPIAHPASADPNHYDRYFFNGHHNNGEFFLGGAMGHYPVRGVIDAAFSIVCDGVEHSIFASGRMPLDRSTVVGPIRIEVVEPLRTIRFIVERNEHGIECDLTFRATTVAVEEPRQARVSPEGIPVMEHTRLTQWGTWEGTVSVDGSDVRVDASEVTGTRDRSWGVRGPRPASNWDSNVFHQVFWLWAPLHFGDRFTHVALHEFADGSRWLETALVIDPLPAGAEPWSTAGVRECRDVRHQLELMPGRREMNTRAELWFTDPVEGDVHIELEKVFTFRMRGIGYNHPYWSHGSLHGELETGRESIKLDDFDPVDPSSIHLQNLVIARMGDRTGVGILEEVHLGPHEPTGLTGFLDGFGS